MTTASELTKHLANLLRREHGAMADFILALADFDRERRWAELGHNGLFMFLHRELGLSKSAAFYRKTAADLVQRHPEIVDALRDGKLCLSTVAEVAKALEVEDISTVLPRVFHASKREAKEVLAELKPVPAPQVRDVVTPMAFPAPRCDRTAASLARADPGTGVPFSSGSPANLPDANSRPDDRVLLSRSHVGAPVVEPLTADLRRLHVTVDRECLDLIEAARDALSHSNPGATSNDVLKAALRIFLAENDRKKKAFVAKPRKDRPSASTADSVPAYVRRAVWKRDQGKCQWPLESGGICACTRKLELAHRDPGARGGPPTVENLRLLCRFHNEYEARLQFGDALVDRYTRRVAPSRTPTTGDGSAARQRALELGP